MISTSCLSQDTIPISRVDTPINFFNQKPLGLHPYNNRVVPFDDINPLYVQINYEDGKNKMLEYFRIDSLRYLVYEFFRNSKGSSNEGLKSRGIMRVTNNIAGTSVTTVNYIGREKNKYTKQTHYYKALSKEGEWDEFEDSVFHHKYWTGNYTNNKRVGLWKHMVYGIGDDFILEEIDYDKDSSIKIFSSNIINTVPLDSVRLMLVGRWNLRGCDEEKELRMFYSKCQIYDGAYGDDCNNKWAKENYYDFTTLTKFERQRGEGCNTFRESSTKGEWKITEKNKQRFIEIKFTNGQTWKLKIIYLDYENNLITDR
jgi:hypothetical protein